MHLTMCIEGFGIFSFVCVCVCVCVCTSYLHILYIRSCDDIAAHFNTYICRCLLMLGQAQTFQINACVCWYM